MTYPLQRHKYTDEKDVVKVIPVNASTVSLHPLSLLRDLCSARTWSLWLHDDPLSALLTIVALLMWLFIARFAIALCLAIAAAPMRRTSRGVSVARAATFIAPKWLRPVIVALIAVPIVGSSVAAGAAITNSDLPSLDRTPIAGAPHPSRGLDRAPILGSEPPAVAISPGLPAPTPSAPSSAAPTSSDGTHVVAVGDCLWRIASAELGPGATNAQIAARWPRWWKANAAVVGSNPNLIYPGQQLAHPSEVGDAS